MKNGNKRGHWIYEIETRFYNIMHHIQTLWADDKHRKAVVSASGINKEDITLDAGTGTGLTARVASAYGCSITGIDISKRMLNQARNRFVREKMVEKIDLVKGDLEDIPFGKDYFNKTISCYGLGGIDNIEKAFEELVRVTVSGGIICVAEMVEPPPQYPVRKLIHNYFVEPWIKFFWGFRDLNLSLLFEENNIEVTKKIYFTDRFLGSTLLIRGVIRK